MASIRYLRAGAVGTREHIIAYLADNTELFDPGGMASTRRAAAVGYPGSSVAFAQLLSGMERSGLTERDVRGKRTYRIGLGSMAGADQAVRARRSALLRARLWARRPGSTMTSWRGGCWLRSLRA